jgi:cytoskeletal protein CcmA (bactofilin family)
LPIDRTPEQTEDKQVSSQAAVARSVNGEHLAKTPKDNWLGFVGDVMKFTGEVSFKSMLRIDGNFSGHVTSPEGTLVVGTGAQVTEAVIRVAVARINGKVEGDISATKELVLGRTATVIGNLAAPALIIEDGASFSGRCRKI